MTGPARERRALLAILAAGAVLRLLFFARRSLWFDEANTLAVAMAPLADLPHLVRALEGFPPLHYLLLHFWLPLWSDPMVGLRSFSLVCGIAALAVFLSLCRRTVPGQERFALLLGCLSSFWIHTAQDGRVYALFLLLALSSGRLLLALEERWSWGRAAAYAGVCAAGLYAHNFFLLLLCANVAYLVLSPRREPGRWRRWLAVFAAIAAVYLPWLASLPAQVRNWSAVSVLSAPLSASQLLYLLGNMLCDTGFLGFAHEGWTRVAGLAVLATAAGIALWRRATPEQRRHALFCLVHIAVPLAAAKGLELALRRPVTQTRYLVFVSPFLFLWFAWIVGRLEGLPGQALRAGIVVLFLAGAAAYHAAGIFVDPHLRELADAIRRGSPSGCAVVHLDAYYYTPLRYYYLPQRPHYLFDPGSRTLNWGALPGYPAAPGQKRISRMGTCVVVDPQRRLFATRLGRATGRQLTAALAAQPSLIRPAGP